MKRFDLQVETRRAVLPEGVRPAKILIQGGRIAAVEAPSVKTSARKVLDVGNLAVLPGGVDTHVHLNEPGRAEWEGFVTGTRAALAGGVTTLVDMPLNCSPVTTTRAALLLKKKAAAGLCRTDYGFWGGVIPGNAAQLEGMARAGALGFKCFLIHSGIDEFPHVGEAHLREAMPILAGLGLPLLFHAELDCGCPRLSGSPRSYARYLASRPKRWENEAVALAARLSLETRCRAHIVHLSSAQALPIVEKARRLDAPLTAETCPHYLALNAEEVADGRTEFKCAPPIRERANAQALWRALARGTLDFVVSDHSPCTPALKRAGGGDFAKAWGGIASVQFSLPTVWTEAARRGHGLPELARWLSEGPARFAGLGHRKGRIAPGLDADLAVFDPDEEWVVRERDVLQRHKLTPYAGRRLRGRVRRVFLRGKEAFALSGAGPRFSRPDGRFLTRRLP